MLQIDTITEDVRYNCSICDSRHAGLYSICGLILRLRDLYKWENRLPPWVEKDSSEIISWIGEKEEMWESIHENEFRELSINGNKYDPFDTEKINAFLEPSGYFYGAGYIQGMKQSFLLAEIDSKKRVDGCEVYFLGNELARDLVTVPALSQGRKILIRKEAAKFYFWDRIFFIASSGKKALGEALGPYGINPKDSKAIQAQLEKISEEQIQTYLYHELGEIKDDVFEKRAWHGILTNFPHSLIEYFSRSVKDLLADSNEYGPLRYFIRERKRSLLAFYVAFQDGIRKILFPELSLAFNDFVNSGDWAVIQHAIDKGYESARSYAESMIYYFMEGNRKKDMKWVENKITEYLLKPLGLVSRINDNI